MNLESGHVYHIYNQGNNRQKIFFNRENYLFFLNKMRNHILPYADVLAWCLMPNHFHIMVYVKNAQSTQIEDVPLNEGVAQSDALNQNKLSVNEIATLSDILPLNEGVAQSDALDQNKLFVNEIATLSDILPLNEGVAQSDALNQNKLSVNEIATLSDILPLNEGIAQSNALNQNKSDALNQNELNHSIGKMLSSYTQAINKELHRTGSLFRKATKAECITLQNGITPSYFKSFSGTIINLHIQEKDYPKVCFDYIHFNPVRAKLVKKPENWEFSSYSDYFCSRNGTLTNKERAKEFLLI